MHRRTGLQLGTLLLLGMTAATPASAASASLAPWRWKFRVLLVFAPDASDAMLAVQRAEMTRDQAGTTDRDLLAFEIVGDQLTSPTGAQGVDASRLRREYHVARDRFTVILVGKDGGEKLRRADPISADALFGIIDRMPMRRGEAASR